jgi:hypothetical protein
MNSSSSDAGGNCGACGSLPQSYLAQTGYGEQFPAAAYQLERLGLDMRRDIWRCKACGALFDWEDNSQLYGSGNLDEETLGRLGPAAAKAVGALLDPGFHGMAGDELVALAAKEVPRPLFNNIVQYLVYRTTRLEPLVPGLVAVLAKDNEQHLVHIVRDWAGRKRQRLAWAIDLIERGGKPYNYFTEALLKVLRETLAKAPA